MARGRDAEKIEALGRIPLFGGLNKKELQFLASMTEPGQEVMVIEDGTGIVRRDDKEIATVGPGDFFGEMSLIDAMPRNADVIASSDMKVLVMNSREFSSVLDKYPEVAVKVLKTVVARLVKAQGPNV